MLRGHTETKRAVSYTSLYHPGKLHLKAFLKPAVQWLADGRCEGLSRAESRKLTECCPSMDGRSTAFWIASMYTWNNEAVAFWEDQNVLSEIRVPYELNEKELCTPKQF